MSHNLRGYWVIGVCAGQGSGLLRAERKNGEHDRRPGLAAHGKGAGNHPFSGFLPHGAIGPSLVSVGSTPPTPLPRARVISGGKVLCPGFSAL